MSPLKKSSLRNRPNVSYPRRRAPIACNFCRRRKRKCDGKRPTCSFCSQLGSQCEYEENAKSRADVESSNEELVLRVSRLESIVQQQANAIAELSATVEARSASEPLSESQLPPINAVGLPGRRSLQPLYYSNIVVPPISILGVEDGEGDDVPLTIPLGHSTTTAALLSLDQIRSLVGDYPEDFFLRLEARRPFEPGKGQLYHLSSHFDTLDLRRKTTDPLVAAFFTHVHSRFPILDQQQFFLDYETFPNPGTTNSMPDILCLVIFALGEISSHFDETADVEESAMDRNGMEYFSAAYQMLTTVWMSNFSVDITLPLALLYAAIYLCHIGRPLQTWRLVHMASACVQFIFAQLKDHPVTQNKHRCLNQVAWGCFVLECDLLAELHLPRSGIEILVDGLLFPQFSDPINRDGLMFLATCSIRRLLNRVHNTIYADRRRNPHENNYPIDNNRMESHKIALIPQISSASLEKISVELMRQLEAWYDSLPEAIKPVLEDPIPRDVHDSVLRLRYWSAKHIICRPCLILAASCAEGDSISEYTMRNSRICVESCRSFIKTAPFLLAKRTQYTWTTMQSLLACVFVLAVSDSNPSLQHLVPDFDDLISRAIQSTETWAHSNSAPEAILEILKTIRQKKRLQSTR